MSNFGVICKAIVHSILNRLFYLPVKYQGPATAWTRVISEFQWVLKIRNCFFIRAVCEDFGRSQRNVFSQLWKRFLSGLWSRYAGLCVSAERLHWNFSAHFLWLLLRWVRTDVSSYRRALLGSLRLGIDFKLFFVNLKNADVSFWCVVQTILHIWKKYRQKTCRRIGL